jgi:hypothetical protein
MNGKISIYMAGYENLKKCFDLANENHIKYCGYKVVTDNEYGTRMFLYWYKSEGLYSTIQHDESWFPYDMNSKQITDFVWGWLEQVDYGDHGEEGDGSYGQGFHFEANDFGNYIKGCDECSVAVVVTPMWFYYGK